MLSVRIGDLWLSTISAYGPVTVEFGLHGLDAASWEMPPNIWHPALRGNAPVQIYDGGIPIGPGTLLEPGIDGQYAARGLWRQAERALALNSTGDPTSWPNDSIAQALIRADISWSGSVAAVDGGWAGTGHERLALAQLLDGYCAEQGTRWSVSPVGIASAAVDPTTPMWHVPHAVAGRGLTPAEDEFATHLVGTYLASAGVFDTVVVGSTDAVNFFGRRSVPVDLTPMGIINSTKATAVLTGMFLRAGARMGWAEGLELSYGQIIRPGGTPAPLSQIQAGQMVRLAGVIDTSRANRLPAYTDIVIAASRYTDGSKTITLEPLGYAPRTLGDVLDLDDAS